MKNIIQILLFIFIAFHFSGCSKNTDNRFAKKKDGKLIISSVIILSTFQESPLGARSKQVIEYYKERLLENNYINVDSLLPKPKIVYKELGDKVTEVKALLLDFSFYNWDFLLDTCVCFFIRDTTKSEQHIKACVEIISKEYGKPTYDNVDPFSRSYNKDTDHYSWKNSTDNVVLVRWKWTNEYYIDYRNERYNEYQKVVRPFAIPIK